MFRRKLSPVLLTDEQVILNQLKDMLPSEEFISIQTAPYEWLNIMYGDMVVLGENYHLINDFLFEVVDKLETHNLSDIFSREMFNSYSDDYRSVLARLGQDEPVNKYVETFLRSRGSISHTVIQYSAIVANSLKRKNTGLSESDFIFLTNTALTCLDQIYSYDAFFGLDTK